MSQSRPLLAFAVASVLALCAAGAHAAAELPPPEALRSWILEMKASPKGPFEAIRWYCKDGTVHPARPYPCEKRGGGIQHGEWSDRARALRDGGFRIANLLAELEPADFVGVGADLDGLRAVLVERFLIRADDGWIFRGARSYRGAFQVEDEEAGGQAVVRAMISDPQWRTPPRFALLRETVRLFPRASDAVSAAQVRQLAVEVASRDPGFAGLRAKIHGVPDPGDAARVRRYAAEKGSAANAALYEKLASAIDALYASRGAETTLELLSKQVAGDASAAKSLRDAAATLRAAVGPDQRLAEASRMLADLRERLERRGGTAARDLPLFEASLALEDEVYAAGNALAVELPAASRRTRLEWLGHAATAVYGTGLIARRHLEGVRTVIAELESRAPLAVDVWGSEVRYLARGPEWAGRWLEFHFGSTTARFGELDPLARLFAQDRLRGSPLLFYGAVVDGLVADANHLAGIEHRLFGKTVGTGLRALNPGIAWGTLLVPPAEELEGEPSLRRDGLYLLPETVADLPRVAGILTRGEGSSLSHVQLLARNLGIPNVVVGEELVPRLQERAGKKSVLAVSPGGVVHLELDGPEWDAVLGEVTVEEDVTIRPDLEKLDLAATELVPLTRLRATDSGRICGPKGANLGELMHHFPTAVPPGVVVPFGVFRALLEKPLEPGGPTVWDWMRQRYAAIAKLSGEVQDREVRAFLERLRSWIQNVELDAELEGRLVRTLEEVFGPDGTWGVFVRSDTNVEDLPGFTGAGLNLTVPNVVGSQNVLRSLRDVWASPFTERAYSWRQAHMDRPEYVFPAVTIQLAFPSEKSGVLVTADVDTGSFDQLSVAVNEGVGGAVEGQAAESLRISTDGSRVRFLAQATAPLRSVLEPAGGVAKVPASGADAVLTADEIALLVNLARVAPRQFPTLRGDDGEVRAADIEFAFRGGKLALLQIRPLNESKRAQRNAYLVRMDAGLRRGGDKRVDLAGVPEVGGR
jgi:hypothetical protein